MTGFAKRPLRARREKTRVGAFSTADTQAIFDLEPDLVLTYSDVQADLTAALIRGGVAVHAFNQRSLAGVLGMIATLGRLVDKGVEAQILIADCARRLDVARDGVQRLARRPLIYFEEWDDPMIAGIGWISELLDAAGGIDVCADRAFSPAARDRVVTAREIVERAPDIMIASWCGKRFRPDAVRERTGFAAIPAVRSGMLWSLPAEIILQPGPALFSDGLEALASIVARWTT